MSVGIIEGDNVKALYCDTTDVAFGPVFYEDEDVDAFLFWLEHDARTYEPDRLIRLANAWRAGLTYREAA